MCKQMKNKSTTTAGVKGKPMPEKEITRRVKKFYEQFRFPSVRPPDQDGLILLRRFSKAAAQSQEKDVQTRVLDAGCGTGNTTISLARQFKDIEFLGVDISAPSLSTARHEARRESLRNIRFRKWDLMNPELTDVTFDIILCLGVLHHTASMEFVLSNLRNVLKDKGELYLWIYGRYGRYRHSLNQRLLNMLLDVKPDSDSRVSLAREFALRAGKGAILDDLFGRPLAGTMWEKIIKEPAWIADQFLHPYETLLTMEELLALTSRVGLDIDQWLGVPQNVSKELGSPELVERFEQLSRHQRLIALDLLLKPEHYFLILRKVQNQKGIPK